jgi:hypothetical protein
MVFVNLCNPNANLLPLYYRTETSDHFTSDDFRRFGNKIFDELATKQITLVGFVGDNLRAQISGLAPWSRNCMQNVASDQDPKRASVLYVPCCCHVLNLVLVDLHKNNQQYADAMKLLGRLSVFMRKSQVVNRIGKRMPDIPQTRWVYAFDAVTWIIQHLEAANTILTSRTLPPKLSMLLNPPNEPSLSTGIPTQIKELAPFLEPIKRLMLALEADDAPLSVVFPLFKRTLEIYKELETNEDIQSLRPAIPDIMNLLNNRFRETSRWELIVTSYAFTRAGRRYFRLQGYRSEPRLTLEFSDAEEADGALPDIIPPSMSEDNTDFNPSSDDDYEDEAILDDHEQRGEREGEEERNIRSEEGTEKEEKGSDNEDEDEDANEDEEEDERADPEDEDLYTIAIKAVGSLAQRMNSSDREADQIKADFHDWLFNPTRQVPCKYLLDKPSWEYWKTVNRVSRGSNLSMLALRFLSLPSSQASCERLISYNRQIIDSHRTRTNDDLVRARNHLRKRKKKIQVITKSNAN